MTDKQARKHLGLYLYHLMYTGVKSSDSGERMNKDELILMSDDAERRGIIKEYEKYES